MKRIAVFCGSSPGHEPFYRELAYGLGEQLAKTGFGLVYGGAKVGLMGAVADGALQAGGEVIGVLPKFLGSKEIAHDKLTDLILVGTMHERKMKMNDLSDGVIALPGGFGTLEELFEMLTWAQLGLHAKPIGLYNINGFYDSLVLLMENMVAAGFLKTVDFDRVLASGKADVLLQRMQAYKPPITGKWITEERT